MDIHLDDAVCPKCGKKGLRHPAHPHAYGHKDYGRLVCKRPKTCGASFSTEKYRAWLEKQPKP
jgi:hypothetical protein